MINFSVSRLPRALILGGQVKKTKNSFVPSVFANVGSVEAASRNSRPLFSFSRRREEGVIKNYLSSSFLFTPFPRTSGFPIQIVISAIL